MKFVTAKSETNFTDLVRRVFDLKGARASDLVKYAEAALRQANPHLRDVATVPAGTLVVVPDVPGVSTAGPPAALVSPDMVAQLQQALAAAKIMLEQSTASEVQAAQDTGALIKSRGVKGMVTEAPDLKARLVQIADQTKVQLKQLDTAKAAQLHGLEQLETNLAHLLVSDE